MAVRNAFGALGLDTTLQSILSKLPTLKTGIAKGDDTYVPVALLPADTYRCGFEKTIASGVDTAMMTVIQTGSGQAVSQATGALVITTGTTANAETIVRSVDSFLGDHTWRYALALSQRIANQSFYVELVDVIGDGLTYVMNSATSITVTFPAGTNPFTALTSVGQSVYLGAITGIAVAIPGRYAIASVSGNTVTFTVAGFTASGSGTLSLFGWNFEHVLYDSTTATSTKFDMGRRGWATGDTSVTISTTAAPGHLGTVTNFNAIGGYLDQVGTPATTLQTVTRTSRVQHCPDNDVTLRLQIRVVNGSSAPATTTTLTVGFVEVTPKTMQGVSLDGMTPQSFNAAFPVQVLNTAAVDTELPAAAALADGSANPTAPQVGADCAVYNGTTWDRLHGNWNTNTGDSGAKSATFNGATQANFNNPGAIITVLMGTVTGTSPTLGLQLQWSPDGGTTWLNFGPAIAPQAVATANTFTFGVYPVQWEDATSTTLAALTTGATVMKLINSPLPRSWRIVYTIGGTTPSIAITGAYINYMV